MKQLYTKFIENIRLKKIGLNINIISDKFQFSKELIV